MEFVDFILVMGCGLVIGVLSGMFGIGGGTMIVPLLYGVFHLPIVGATSTSLLTIAPTGISGSIKHLRQKTASLKTGLIMGGTGALASVGGSLVADYLPPSVTVVLTASVILFSIGLMAHTLLRDRKRDKKGGASGSEAAGEPQITTATTEAQPQKTRMRTVLPFVIGLIAGGVAGIVGVGGGFLIVPFCVAYLNFSLKKAAGTSLISIAIIAIPGIVSHALLGHIEWLYGLALILGTVPGAQIGSRLIAKLPERPMRIAFMGLLLIVIALMLVQEFLL